MNEGTEQFSSNRQSIINTFKYRKFAIIIQNTSHDNITLLHFVFFYYYLRVLTGGVARCVTLLWYGVAIGCQMLFSCGELWQSSYFDAFEILYDG